MKIKFPAQHQDPIRHPNVFAPIEEEMIDIHTKGVKTMMVDITKKLVQLKKK